MHQQLKLLGIFAHPDDATMTLGGLLAQYADEGVATALLVATRGEREWFGDPADNPGIEAVGRIREAELHVAAADLGVTDVALLGYIEGQLNQADPATIISQIVGQLRRLRPHVVVTSEPLGFYGDPDHVAIAQFATAAVLAAADPSFSCDPPAPAHRIAKLYYLAPDEGVLAPWREHFGRMRIEVAGVERRPPGWQPWAITTRIDAAPYWARAWGAVCRHASQLPQRERLEALPVEVHQRLWCSHTLYRALSLVNGGPEVEHDLFVGLR